MQRRFTQVQEWDNQGLVIQRSAKSCERKSKAWLWSAVYLNEGPIASTSGQASGLYVLFFVVVLIPFPLEYPKPSGTLWLCIDQLDPKSEIALEKMWKDPDFLVHTHHDLVTCKLALRRWQIETMLYRATLLLFPGSTRVLREGALGLQP